MPPTSLIRVPQPFQERFFEDESNTFEPEPWMQSLPGIKRASPRDGEKLQRTRDVLFVAALLERSKGEGWVKTSKVFDGFRYEPSGPPPGDAKPGTHYMKVKALRSIFRQNDFWSLRRLVAGPDGHKIELPPIPPTYSVTSGSDLLMETFHEQTFLSWCSQDSQSPFSRRKKNQVYCPLCGPTTPERGIITTPAETWALSCGSRWSLWICTGCLGVFDEGRPTMLS